MNASTHISNLSEVKSLFYQPLGILVHKAHVIHLKNFNSQSVQKSTLLSIKTGACPEDCGYCSQSARNNSNLKPEKLIPLETVIAKAKDAKASGSTRFCMGAAWREVKDGKDFDRVLEMVQSVSNMGLEVCCTLGMMTEAQAIRLKEAGCYAYNHNIDTSEAHYKNIITTRTFLDRLNTIKNVRKSGMTVCCGVILGLGETEADQISFLHTLSSFDPHPESVPINNLVPISGTPLENQKPVDAITMVRVIALARILMPKTMVRLSAGRLELTDAEQFLCFHAGANSIFAGDKLLTTPNPEQDADHLLFDRLGIQPAQG
jgi:biotin synthase